MTRKEQNPAQRIILGIVLLAVLSYSFFKNAFAGKPPQPSPPPSPISGHGTKPTPPTVGPKTTSRKSGASSNALKKLDQQVQKLQRRISADQAQLDEQNGELGAASRKLTRLKDQAPSELVDRQQKDTNNDIVVINQKIARLTRTLQAEKSDLATAEKQRTDLEAGMAKSKPSSTTTQAAGR